MTASVGQLVPDVAVAAYDRTKDNTESQFTTVKLSDYRGKWVCLYFYPLDFTFVCPTEIVSFNDNVGEFADRDCILLTASTDSEYSHKGWCDAHKDLAKMKHLMLSDKTRELTSELGILKEDLGIAYRGTFLIDPHGVIRYVNVNDLSVGRNVSEVLRVLDALQTDKLCPCNWKKGDSTLN